MLFQQIENNKRKTVGITIGFILVALLAGGASTYYFTGNFLSGLLIMAIVLVVYIPLSLLASNLTIMTIAEGTEVKGELLLDPKLKQLDNIVEELSIAAGINKPKVYIIETDAQNAFATGMSPEKSSVAITRGLLENLDREEVEGVMAHELAHIVNYDVRLTTVALALATIILLLTELLTRIMLVGSARDNKNPIGLILVIVFFVVLPVLTKIIEMALSRNREYLADATAVELTRNPVGLKRALVKLALQPKLEEHKLKHSLNQLYISSPKLNFGSASKGTQYEDMSLDQLDEMQILDLLAEEPKSWFSTHPRMYDRIKSINEL